MPGEADREVNGESAVTSVKTGRGLRPEVAEAGPALFGPMDGERLGVQVAALADELGLDPPAKPMESRSFNASRSPQLKNRDGEATPRGGVRVSSGGEKSMESRASRNMFPSPAYWTPPTTSTPPVSSQVPPLMAVLQEKLTEAQTRLGRRRQGRKWLLQVLAERVLDSTADTLVMGELDSRRRKCHTGRAQTALGKRKREEQRDGSKKKGRSSSREETVESHSSDEGLGKEDESKVRRTAATKPGALLHSGLVMMQRHLGRQVEDCEAVDAVQAKGLAAAYLATALKPNAGSKLSFGALRELQSLAESVDLLMRGRVASAGDVLMQRFRAVEAASLEEGGWSVARHLEVLPEETVSTISSSLRGVVMKAERARLRLRQGQWKRSPREEKEGPFARDQRWRSAVEEEEPRANRQRGREDGRWRKTDLPEGSTVEQPGPRRSERTEQGKANQVTVAGEVVPLVVCGAQRVSLSEKYLGKALPPHSVYMGRSGGSHGNPGGWGNPF